MVLALLAGVGVAFAAYGALRLITPVDASKTAAEIDVTRVALTMVAGVGGVVALVIAYRRQRDLEQSRFVERFGAAAAQLGATDVAVRIAGVYAMSGVADESDGQRRQQCIDVLCGYLRLPYDAEHGASGRTKLVIKTQREAGDETEEHIEYRQNDREVRATIIRVIADHLHPTAEQSWSDYHFDFRTAHLENVDLSGVVLRGLARFDNATFYGTANFRYTDFSNLAAFHKATFHGTANFRYTDFSNLAAFHKATFHGTANFHHATFSAAAFDLATFHGRATFRGATFSGPSEFTGAVFKRFAAFDWATFSEPASFSKAAFADLTVFNNAIFTGTNSFANASFSIEAKFREVTFSRAVTFRGATFSGPVDFTRVAFSGPTDFSAVEFGNQPVTFANPKQWGPPPPVFDWAEVEHKPPNVNPQDWPPTASSTP
ncbi:Uncharacterised protein [Nocardia farcinica]|uniref:Pentapeptide repeat-containing protein n=1 Tax=Nocardia farcinica TaxID=37329 RepID=A0A449G5U6_NOCFR|nr:Uncharacterised protein [Nocardia farcinica]